MSGEAIDGEVRRRVEDRHRDSSWRVFVCAEPDGENCGSGTNGVDRHECAAGIRFRRGEGPRPLVAWVAVSPTREPRQ